MVALGVFLLSLCSLAGLAAGDESGDSLAEFLKPLNKEIPIPGWDSPKNTPQLTASYDTLVMAARQGKLQTGDVVLRVDFSKTQWEEAKRVAPTAIGVIVLANDLDPLRDIIPQGSPDSAIFYLHMSQSGPILQSLKEALDQHVYGNNHIYYVRHIGRYFNRQSIVGWASRHLDLVKDDSQRTTPPMLGSTYVTRMLQSAGLLRVGDYTAKGKSSSQKLEDYYPTGKLSIQLAMGKTLVRVESLIDHPNAFGARSTPDECAHSVTLCAKLFHQQQMRAYNAEKVKRVAKYRKVWKDVAAYYPPPKPTPDQPVLGKPTKAALKNAVSVKTKGFFEPTYRTHNGDDYDVVAESSGRREALVLPKSKWQI